MEVIAIDDEQHCINALRVALEENGIQLSGYSTDLVEGVNLIKDIGPELVFLDIELGDHLGFELFDYFPNPDFKVIFTTAHSKYAVRAFRFSALDYLLKPLDSGQLMEALDKLTLPKSSQINVLKKGYQGEQSHIILKNIDAVHVVNIAEILCLQADGSYTRFQLNDGNEILIGHNLKSYEQLLRPLGFLRVHRSYLVKGSSIKKFNNQQSTLEIEGGHVVPTTLTKESFLEIMS